MSKKCPNCGACPECGAQPPYAVQPYKVRPYPYTVPYTGPYTQPTWVSPNTTGGYPVTGSYSSSASH